MSKAKQTIKRNKYIMRGRRMARILTFCAFCFCCGLGGAVFAQTQAPLPLPRDFRGNPVPVGDYAEVLDAATEDRLNKILKNLDDRAGIQFAVVTVKTTQPQEIFDYTLNLARGWGIGTKDGTKPGLIMVVAIEDRKYFTQVSRHLEGDLPDSIIGQIQRAYLVPNFRSGNYNAGIAQTVEAFVATLAQKRGFSIEGIDQRLAVRTQPQKPVSLIGSINRNTVCCLIIIIIIIILIFSGRGKSGGSGHGRYGGGGGWLPFIIASAASSSSNSGWSGGGFGGSSDSGGGGSDWGGFSGGGGDFGGGGAGGDW